MSKKTRLCAGEWIRRRHFLISPLFVLFVIQAQAQTAISLNDLSSFKTPSSSWRMAGSVTADLNKSGVLQYTPGTGILVNTPDSKNTGADLYTNIEHNDADIELDFLLAKGANSGVYLQGRYEVQLFDSWGVQRARHSDNGGVYERWDESRGKGLEGFEGYAPRQSVSKAPGLWQHLKISFQAPRFDANGKKTENAKILRAELNGVAIHENLELFGPTRGASGAEASTGPLRFQGDHGAVAFKNIRIFNYNKPRPQLTNLTYNVYRGFYDKEPDYAKLPPEAKGPSGVLTTNLNSLPDSFLLRYSGTLKVQEPGEYNFNLSTPAGIGMLRINNQVVADFNRRRGAVRTTLPAGELPFELLYSKYQDWTKPTIGLSVSGPGIREYTMSDANNVSGEPVDPILVDAPVNTLLRSFIDIPGMRITHAISVGTPEGVHYTYDLDKGAIAQAWRGGFLDATPMWHERGDGSSRPTGTVQRLGKPVFSIARLSSAAAPWPQDTIGSGFRSKGYVLDDKDRPSFRYSVYGTTVMDSIRVDNESHGLNRTIELKNAANDIYARLAEGSVIDDLGNGLYTIDNQSYYIRIENGAGQKPLIRDAAGKKELIIPVRSKLSYSILF